MLLRLFADASFPNISHIWAIFFFFLVFRLNTGYLAVFLQVTVQHITMNVGTVEFDLVGFGGLLLEHCM